MFVGNFCPPGSGSNPDPDPQQCLSSSAKQCCGSGSRPCSSARSGSSIPIMNPFSYLDLRRCSGFFFLCLGGNVWKDKRWTTGELLLHLYCLFIHCFISQVIFCNFSIFLLIRKLCLLPAPSNLVICISFLVVLSSSLQEKFFALI